MKSAIISVVLFIHCVQGRTTTQIEVNSDEDDTNMHPHFPAAEERLFTPRNVDEQTSEYWKKLAAEFTAKQLQKPINEKIAKNVILFLGDGMSVSTFSATRVYVGGEERQLTFEKFPYVAMSKTYCVDYQVPDSACTATAYLTGVKGNYGTIGVNAKVKRYNCTAGLDKDTHTHSIAKWAMNAGKDAGIVTTTRVTHASPAGIYAHIADRDWENDDKVEKQMCDSKVVDDIAKQLVRGETASQLKVILGGGRREFLGTTLDPETGLKGLRKDGLDLIEEWQQLGGVNETRKYVWHKDALLDIDPATTDKLLGLFEPGHCVYNLDRIHKNLDKEPTLTQMVDKATDILKKNKQGFFLFVEGGRIDHAHHDTQARYALDETVEFSRAIEFLRKKFNEDDTLIVVTSDHGHTMSYAGYPVRNNDIFGQAGKSATDKLPYMTLSYANGKGFNTHVNQKPGGRVDIGSLDTTKDDFMFPATVPVDSETHGGEDVAIFASGPYSHLFTGSLEQNAIPHIMAYASCIGDGLTACS